MRPITFTSAEELKKAVDANDKGTLYLAPDVWAALGGCKGCLKGAVGHFHGATVRVREDMPPKTYTFARE